MKQAILITGAGSGIGLAIAQTLSKSLPTTPLILVGRNLGRLQEARSTLTHPELHEVYSLDVSDHPSIIEFRAHLQKKNISLQSVILNAGIGGENQYGENDRWNEIIATNLTGPYLLTQELLPLIRADKNEFKNIIFTSSILARLGIPRYTAYCASKAGLLGLMRSLAGELASKKILVNAICPGWVDTEMSSEGLKDIAHVTGKTITQVRSEQMAMVALGKMSTPHEIAQLVHFLVSGVQTSITGQTLDINNGALMV